MRNCGWLLLLVGGALMVLGCRRNEPAASSVQAGSASEIAWREGDIEDAFAEAKATNKPVLLYWGAKWCPPCNIMKQALFKDPAFVARTASFVSVHLDGDAKDAQLWGDRFGIQGYPTIIILSPERREITRLTGSSTAAALADTLRLAADRSSSIEDLLNRARNPKTLSRGDWNVLANFDWQHDPVHFGDLAKGAQFYAHLGDAAPYPAMARHFALTSLIMATKGADTPKLSPAQQAEIRAILPPILTDYREAKVNRQELSYDGARLILALPADGGRQKLGEQFVAALERIGADTSLSLDDRLVAVNGEIELSQGLRGGKIAPDVLARVRQRVAVVDKAATDPWTRQSVIYDAGEALWRAGDTANAEKLIRSELPRAIGPYLYMLDLASIEEEEKHYDRAIGWLRRAADTAQGPATRVQWATIYSSGVIRMAPDDEAAVEAGADAVVQALSQNSSGYAERTAKRAMSWAAKMHEWSDKYRGAAVLARLQDELDKACAKGRCKNVLRESSKPG